MSAELAVYDAMPEPVDQPTQDYLDGLKDGVEAAVRRFSRLRHNASSQWISPAIEGKKPRNCFLFIDHVDEVLAELLAAANR